MLKVPAIAPVQRWPALHPLCTSDCLWSLEENAYFCVGTTWGRWVDMQKIQHLIISYFPLSVVKSLGSLGSSNLQQTTMYFGTSWDKATFISIIGPSKHTEENKILIFPITMALTKKTNCLIRGASFFYSSDLRTFFFFCFAFAY